MNNKVIEDIIATSYSLTLHIVLLGLFLVGMEPTSTPYFVVKSKIDIVQATVIDEAQVLAEMALLEEFEDKKKKQEQDRQVKADKALKEKQEKLVRKQRELKVKQARRAAEEKRKLAEADRRAEEKRKREAEKARKIIKENKRKAEEARKLKENRKIEAEHKAQRVEADRLLQGALDKEKDEREERRVTGVIKQNVAMIKQRIKRYWIRPSSAESGLECTLHVSLMPGGDIKLVTVVASSGNAVFDRSAASAVYKAAPWPQPRDIKAAAALRDFQFIFKPE